MTEQRTDAYEGMFLFPQVQSADLGSAMNHIGEILEKVGASIISMRKWDERRLAFEIKGNKRGVYFLVYFETTRESLAAIERACNLSEIILRSMMTRCEHLTRDEMQAADGREELHTEIKLREEQAQADAARAEATPAQVVTPSDEASSEAEPAKPAEPAEEPKDAAPVEQ